MKKRFLGALATGLFLFGISGYAQALTIDARSTIYPLDPDYAYNTAYKADPTNPGIDPDPNKDTWVNVDVYNQGDELILYGFENDNNAPINALLSYLSTESISADLLYKFEYTGGEVSSSALASSYDSSFANESGGTITYTGGDFIGSPAFIIVKDGRQTPAWYIFDLTQLNWNGIDDIVLQNFWSAQGGISNIAIYGTPNAIPEPGTLLLFGTGLAGLAAVGRRRKN